MGVLHSENVGMENCWVECVSKTLREFTGVSLHPPQRAGMIQGLIAQTESYHALAARGMF